MHYYVSDRSRTRDWKRKNPHAVLTALNYKVKSYISGINFLKTITNLNNKFKLYSLLTKKIQDNDTLSLYTGRKTSYKDYYSLLSLNPTIKRYRSLLTKPQTLNFFTLRRYIYYIPFLILS